MAETPTEGNDIVLITVDSLQHDYITDGDVPDSDLVSLASLAEDGTFFTNAFSNASITKASFLSIFGGTYPWTYGSIPGGFDSERPHLAEELSRAGYTTAGFNTNPYLGPTYGYDRGFDYFMGRDTDEVQDKTTVSAKYWPKILSVLPSKRLGKAIRSLYGTVGARMGVQTGGDPYVPAEAVNEAVFRLLETATAPRFLWIHYMDVHTPYYPHEGTPSEDIGKRDAIKLFHRANQTAAETDPADLDRLERLYRGEVQVLDRRLGELIDGLAERIDMDRSLVILASDHGEAFGSHGAVFHPDGLLYDEQVHVPLVVNGPGYDAGTVSRPVSNADIMPTVLQFAGADVPPECVGEPLADVIADRSSDRVVFASGHDAETGIAMVTSGSHKLIRDLEHGDEELYDRREDPAERRNRLRELPEVGNKLRRELESHLELAREGGSGETEAVEVDSDVKTRLRMLGYDE